MIPIDFRTAGNIRQRWTHRGLVNRTEQRRHYPGLPLDAIVVPASRAAGELETAVTLARAAGSQLVILCSHEAVPEAVHEYLVKRSFGDAIVVGIPDDYRHDLLDFQALSTIEDKIPAASCYSTNLSTKRNLGLIMARMLGWERIFFLDDDIRDIALPDLQSTVAMLASYRAAGMRVTEFPDNSAACHAHRMTRGTQDVFLTGAALAVDVRPKAGFFPRLYNEDWLYFYDDALNGQLASSGRSLTQLVYDPFADPQRAAWQEFGDTLVEGLYALIDDGRGLPYADGDYWRRFPVRAAAVPQGNRVARGAGTGRAERSAAAFGGSLAGVLDDDRVRAAGALCPAVAAGRGRLGTADEQARPGNVRREGPGEARPQPGRLPPRLDDRLRRAIDDTV